MMQKLLDPEVVGAIAALGCAYGAILGALGTLLYQQLRKLRAQTIRG